MRIGYDWVFAARNEGGGLGVVPFIWMVDWFLGALSIFWICGKVCSWVWVWVCRYTRVRVGEFGF